ncbi:biotin/lipoyl-binding protein, partial [Asanoa sp. NPDC050611]|uniref:biotin/lipoyl-binding protein n=1 Tax=Asanoa sp. NPDC050611 TaxID=3157098 RepID=UPI0033DF942E
MVVLAAGGAAAVAFTREPRAVASTSDTSRVDRGAVSLAVATTGAVTPARSYALGFGTSGTVSAVAVRAGATVTKGQVLARVDDADARAKVSAAETAADRAADALDAAQRSAQDCARRTTAPTRRATPTQPVTSTRRATPSGRPTPTATTSATRTTSPGRTASPRATATTPAAQDRCAATGADQVLGARRQATAAGLALDEARATLAGTTIRAPIAGTVLALSTAVGAAATPGGTVLT